MLGLSSRATWVHETKWVHIFFRTKTGYEYKPWEPNLINKQNPTSPTLQFHLLPAFLSKKYVWRCRFTFFILNLALLLHILHCLFKLTCHIRFTLNRLCKVWRTTLLASTDTFFENPNEPPPFLHKVLRKVKYRNFEW